MAALGLALEYRELRFAYGGGQDAVDGAAASPWVLDGVSGGFGPGEFVSIIGPNGAGKSTLLRLLDGLETPVSGEILLGGQRLSSFDHKARARAIAFVPQYLSRVPEVTVGDFVLGGRYAHLEGWGRRTAADRDAVQRALAGCDVSGLEGRLLGALSGGQRQRVLIARTLAQEASLLLVDEPTNSLDPAHQLAIFELLAGLAQAGRSVVVVTHDLNLASQFSTRIEVMDRGQMVATGSPSEVLCPAVLHPVYGPGLAFGERKDGAGAMRPFVLSWR